MPRLVLMRHAKSDWNNADLYDHQRPLNARGRTAAAALGDWLRARSYLPDEILCSSATRTVETLKGLALGAEVKPEFIRRLYHADAATMLDVLRGAQGQCVLMIGHNPGICDMAQRLLDRPHDHPRMDDYPTGATLVADFNVDLWSDIDWGQGRAVEFIVPRELTG